MLWVLILNMIGGDLQFKVDSEWQIFWKSLHANFICSQSFFLKSAERKSPKKYFSYFVLMPGLGLSVNRPTRYLLDHGDLKNRYFKSFKKCSFINNYLVPFKATPIVFSNPRNTSETGSLVAPAAFVSIFFISSIIAKRFPFSGVFSIGKCKSGRTPSLVNTVV